LANTAIISSEYELLPFICLVIHIIHFFNKFASELLILGLKNHLGSYLSVGLFTL
jgi:hypothetical protein